jgi:hypothetical protein
VFEAYDGTNGTWGTGDPQFRAVPAGYESHAVVNATGAAVETPPFLDSTLGDGS